MKKAQSYEKGKKLRRGYKISYERLDVTQLAYDVTERFESTIDR